MKQTQRKRLCALFVSFTVVIIGAVSLLENMSLDYYTVLGTLKKIVPASIIIGSLGWVMGMVLDKPKKRGLSSYNKLMMSELMKKDNMIVPSISENLDKEKNL